MTIEAATDCFVSVGANMRFHAAWAGHVESVVVTGETRDGLHRLMGLHLSPVAARELAAQLLAAVEQAGNERSEP